MMSEKRYFKIEYDEEWYLFDSTTISEQLVKEQAEYGYGVFANSLSPSEICELLNELHNENKELKAEIEQSDLISKDIVCADIQHQLLKVTDENKELKKENEKLRKKLEQIYSFKGLNCRCVNGV